MCKVIELTKSYFALVDDDVFEELNKYNWNAHETGGEGIYAERGVWEDGRVRTIKMHAQIMGQRDVDHITHDLVRFKIIDNRRSNLRRANRSQNMANRRKHRVGSSKFKGVSWRKDSGKWMSRIGQNGRGFLGYFIYEKEAALAYDSKAKELYGEFALTNRMLYPNDFKEVN